MYNNNIYIYIYIYICIYIYIYVCLHSYTLFIILPGLLLSVILQFCIKTSRPTSAKYYR